MAKELKPRTVAHTHPAELVSAPEASFVRIKGRMIPTGNVLAYVNEGHDGNPSKMENVETRLRAGLKFYSDRFVEYDVTRAQLILLDEDAALDIRYEGKAPPSPAVITREDEILILKKTIEELNGRLALEQRLRIADSQRIQQEADVNARRMRAQYDAALTAPRTADTPEKGGWLP